MQAQCCLVAVNSLADAFTIFRPQPPQHEIRPIVLGKFGKTVNSTMFSNPVCRLYVVGMCILCIARSFGLLRSEEARLRFRKLVESPALSLRCWVMHNTTTILRCCATSLV